MSELSDLFRLLDHVPTGIILLDRQGTVVRINRTASERIAQREMLPEIPQLEQGLVHAARTWSSGERSATSRMRP